MKTPYKIIIIWREIKDYPPYVFHIFNENEIEEARKFVMYAMEKDYEFNDNANYTINFYEKPLDKSKKI